MRDEHYTPFDGRAPAPLPIETVFVMTRLRGDQTDSMRGARRVVPHGCEAVYTRNGELYRSQWFAHEELARADLATHRDQLTGARWIAVPFTS